MPQNIKEETVQEILRIAKESGVESSVAESMAQKCWDDYLYNWKPYGGATSFEEIDSKKAADTYAMKVEEETYALRSIVDNITSSDELNEAAAKSAAIVKAANDYQSRIEAVQLGAKQESKVKDFLGKISSFLGKKEEPVIKFTPGMKVYKDKQGRDRWLSFSSNAFMDLDRELFTTKALEEAVGYADKSGERGPLMFYHIPGTECGQCDTQAIAGRFLVESGTFYDTPLGAKALEYLKNSEDEHQVSIGYEYIEGDQLDGVYDWLRIKERSFLPFGTAANPWTDFKLIGEKEMDQRHRDALENVFGKELTETIVAGAEARTKELEASVSFKAKKPAEDEEEDDSKFPPKKKENETVEAVAEPVVTVDQLKGLGELIANLTAEVQALGSVKEVVASMQEEIKELKKSDEEKQANLNSPRYNPAGTVRPTESNSNVVDPSKVKEMANMVQADLPVNPALAYLQQLGLGQPVEA